MDSYCLVMMMVMMMIGRRIQVAERVDPLDGALSVHRDDGSSMVTAVAPLISIPPAATME